MTQFPLCLLPPPPPGRQKEDKPHDKEQELSRGKKANLLKRGEITGRESERGVGAKERGLAERGKGGPHRKEGKGVLRFKILVGDHRFFCSARQGLGAVG